MWLTWHFSFAVWLKYMSSSFLSAFNVLSVVLKFYDTQSEPAPWGIEISEKIIKCQPGIAYKSVAYKKSM